jgi:threonine dehydratase
MSLTDGSNTGQHSPIFSSLFLPFVNALKSQYTPSVSLKCLLMDVQPISLEAIRSAQERIADVAVRTPLICLNVEKACAEIYLKLENLQPPGAFKLRGAYNAITNAEAEQLADGVWTVSSGNMAKAVAWCARYLDIKCTVIVLQGTSDVKINAIKKLGAQVIELPVPECLQILRTHHYDMKGLMVHPFSNPWVMAGNGTIGLEIMEDLPDVDAVIMPWGGGGLCCGVASAFRAVKPETRLYACEVDTTAPLVASLQAGEPVEIDYQPSFVEGIGAPLVFPEMWALGTQLIDGSLVVGLDEITATIRILADRNHVIAEGAGAASVAAALAGKAGNGKIACIVSGGNISFADLITIFAGNIP